MWYVCILGKKPWIWLPNVAYVVYLVIQCTHKSLSGNHKPPPGLTAIVVKSIGLITSQKKALIRMLFLWGSFLEDIYSINRLLYWKYHIDFELLLNKILSFYRDIIKETTSKTMSLLKIFWIFVTITLLFVQKENAHLHTLLSHIHLGWDSSITHLSKSHSPTSINVICPWVLYQFGWNPRLNLN